MKPYRLAIFASGNGTNAEQIIRYFAGHPSIGVAVVAGNKAQAPVMERARRLDIPTAAFSKSEFYSDAFVQQQKANGITHIVLAGFLWLVPEGLLQAFPHRIINIHPSLLPRFGGKGMYGMRVHEAVKQSGESQTGITIHEVTGRYDEGPVILQAQCPVFPTDTPDQIAGRVHALEHEHYPRAIERWVLNSPAAASTQTVSQTV
jgi:phosphoribosylglycinamide formyltransferase-1